MKYSISSKYNMEIVTIKTQKNEWIVDNEVLWINSQRIMGLVPVEPEQKGQYYSLNYNMTGFIPISKYIKRAMYRNEFMTLLDSIVHLFKSLEDNGLSWRKLLLEDKAVYINPVSKKCQFIYVPLGNYDNNKELNRYLKHIFDAIHFDKTEEMSYVERFKQIIDNPDISWNDLTAYVNWLRQLDLMKFKQNPQPQYTVQQETAASAEMNGNPNINEMSGSMPVTGQLKFNNAAVQTTAPASEASFRQDASSHIGQGVPEHRDKFCPKCGTKNFFDAKFCKKCGNPFKPVNANPDVWKAQGINPQQTHSPVQPDYTEIHKSAPEAMISYEDEPEENTTVLGQPDWGDEEATTVLGGVKPKVVYPYLIRESTQERVEVNKDMFIIGKGKSSDYVVVGNNAVSRSHVTVITREGHYYISDNHSTNHTYINGEQIEPDREYEVTSGTKLVLGNEVFKIFID